MALDALSMKDAEVLALNSGSSSLKFGLYRVGPSRIETLLAGEADAIGAKDAGIFESGREIPVHPVSAAVDRNPAFRVPGVFRPAV